jgi:hypothetical protein
MYLQLTCIVHSPIIDVRTIIEYFSELAYNKICCFVEQVAHNNRMHHID